MWKLSTGTTVEEVLYKAFRNESSECLEHSFIIDMGQKSRYEKLFKKEDWIEICGKKPE